MTAVLYFYIGKANKECEIENGSDGRVGWAGLGFDVLERRNMNSLRRLRSKEVEATDSAPTLPDDLSASVLTRLYRK